MDTALSKWVLTVIEWWFCALMTALTGICCQKTILSDLFYCSLHSWTGQILVATPGRLKDHIENTAGFATRLRGVNVLVLDEADHLLDMGFRKDIERIIAAVPSQRQTLLFSATVPEEVSFSPNMFLNFRNCRWTELILTAFPLFFCEGPSSLPYCIEKGSRIYQHSWRR